MLKELINQYISEHAQQGKVEMFAEEKEFAEKNQVADQILFVERDAKERFADAYIERCDKETENMIRHESSSFLTQPLVYLHKHKNEFIYLESKWLDFIRVDSVSLELDDVFKTYDVMLGIKLPKKFAPKLKEYLADHLHGGNNQFDLLFNGEEGLWNLNFALNGLEGFDENLTIGDAYQLIYQFLFQLILATETE